MTRTSNLRDRLLYGGGYVGFFMFAFVISAYYTFPYERLRDLIIERVSHDATDGGSALALKLGSLNPSWLTGVKLDDVELTSTAPDNPEPATLRFDSVTLRASALSLLMGTVKVSAAARLGEGTIDANYAQSGTQQQIDAEFSALDVHAMGLGDFVGVPLTGITGGTVNVTIDQDPMKSAGDIALKIVNLHIGDGKAKLKIPGMGAGLTLEEIDAGTLDVALNLHDGIGEVDRFNSNGHDLKVDGAGTMHLAMPMPRTRLDVQLELKFSDAFKNKNPHTKSLFELIGMQSDWRRATSQDGAIHLHLAGAFQALRVTPASGNARLTHGAAHKRAAADKAKPAAAAPTEGH